MATCYVYEHLEFRADIPGPVAFALLFLERLEIVEKRSNSDDNWRENDVPLNVGNTSPLYNELGNHYALITGTLRPIQLMCPLWANPVLAKMFRLALIMSQTVLNSNENFHHSIEVDYDYQTV